MHQHVSTIMNSPRTIVEVGPPSLQEYVDSYVWLRVLHRGMRDSRSLRAAARREYLAIHSRELLEEAS